jgi:hypothetical protein
VGGVSVASELLDLMVKDIPPSFVLAIQQAMPHIYEEAYQQAYSQPLWERSEGRYLIGHIRHALFNAQFRKAGRDAQLDARLMRVPVGSYEYSYVRTKGKLFLTGSSVSSSDDMPRPADFREQHAEVNHFLNQPPLSFMASPDLKKAKEIYAIVIHAALGVDKRECGFVGIGIPSADTSEWLELVTLSELYKAQVQAGFSKPEQTQDQAFPTKREKKSEGTGDKGRE